MDSQWHRRYFPDRDIHFCCPGCRKNGEAALKELFDRLFELALAAAEACDHQPFAPETAKLRAVLASLDQLGQPRNGPHSCRETHQDSGTDDESGA